MTETTRPGPSRHVDDMLPLVAIGIATADDQLAVERHLVDCKQCREEFAAFVAVGEELVRHELRAPRPNLWESIERSLPAPGDRRRDPKEWRARMLWWGSLAAAVTVGLLAGGALMLLVNQRDEPSPLESIQRVETDDAVFTLAALSKESAAAGRIFMNQTRTQGVVAVTGLPSLPAGERYAVWIVRDDASRISAGTFAVAADGSAVAALVLPDLQYDWAVSGRYVALSISRIRADTPGVPVGGPILVGPLY